MIVLTPFGRIRHAWIEDPGTLSFSEWIETFGGRVAEDGDWIHVIFDNDDDAIIFRLKCGM